MTSYQLRKYAETFGISIEAACRMRIRYLIQLCGQWDDYLDEQTGIMPESTTMAAIDEIAMLRKFERNYNKKHTGGITDEMIDRARQYPIEQLIEFDRQGKAYAWCHTDKTPSLVLWKDKGLCTCFPCGLTFNPIDVLIDRDGKSFVEAVKQLQN